MSVSHNFFNVVPFDLLEKEEFSKKALLSHLRRNARDLLTSRHRNQIRNYSHWIHEHPHSSNIYPLQMNCI